MTLLMTYTALLINTVILLLYAPLFCMFIVLFFMENGINKSEGKDLGKGENMIKLSK